MTSEQENNKTFESGADLDDFSRLYDRHVKAIYRFIYYKTHHKETTEDLTSAAFVKALNNFNSFRLEKGDLTTWLYQIARNTVIDFYRTKKSNLNIEDVWDLSDDTDIESDAHISQQLEDVKKHLNTLKAEQREIIILRVWEDLSYREIAQITGKTEENCKVIFSRAISKLRSSISIISLLLLFFKL